MEIILGPRGANVPGGWDDRTRRYEMWDELRARHPGLLLDSCASGGRRIDLEVRARARTNLALSEHEVLSCWRV